MELHTKFEYFLKQFFSWILEKKKCAALEDEKMSLPRMLSCEILIYRNFKGHNSRKSRENATSLTNFSHLVKKPVKE